MPLTIKEDTACYASQLLQDVLGHMSEIDIVAKNFFVTGGTTLSVFYLHHRVSEDIDFFSTDFTDLNAVDIVLKRLFKMDLTVIQSSSAFYSYLIKGIKVDVVFDPLSTIESRPLVNLEVGKDIFVDTLANIASNKLSAMASRSEAKDLIDFYFIGDIVWKGRKKDSFLDCYDMAKKKEALFDDPPMVAYQIEELFNRVITEKENALPPMRKKIDWEIFQKDLRFYIDTIYHLEKW